MIQPPDSSLPNSDGDSQNNSELTLSDMLHSVRLFCGFPDEKRLISFGDVAETYSEEQVIWLLRDWVRGDVEAFDPGSKMPVLSPRSHRGIRVSWDYVSGTIPLDLGFYVGVETTHSDLAMYGTFCCRPDGTWSFALHNHDLPILRRILAEQPVLLPVSLLLKNNHTEAEDRTCLFLHVEREREVGLTVRADYRDLHFHGFGRTIRDLAENCVRGKVFNLSAFGSNELNLWIEVVSWLFSILFTRRLPRRVANLMETGTPENQTVHGMHTEIVRRMATMVFDREKVEESIARFDPQSDELFLHDDKMEEYVEILDGAEDERQKRKRGKPARADWPHLIALMAIICYSERESSEIKSDTGKANRLKLILGSAGYIPPPNCAVAPSRDSLKANPVADVFECAQIAIDLYLKGIEKSSPRTG